MDPIIKEIFRKENVVYTLVVNGKLSEEKVKININIQK